MGLLVAAADTGRVWYAHLPDLPLKPASVQKLFVTAAVLGRFGPDFQYRTRLFTQGDNLIVVGAGDPGLGDQRIAARHGRDLEQLFDAWATALRHQGRTSLDKVVLDDAVFDQQWRHPDWPDDQADRWYQAPVGGLNINDNCLDVTVVAGAGRVTLQLHPDLPRQLVQNTLKLGSRQRPIVKRHPDRDVFLVQGTVKRGGALDPVSAREPTLFFAHALKQALRQRGIEVRGPVVRRQLNADELSSLSPLATHTTNLEDVLWRCNTFSQNLFAECLLKSLAAYQPDGRRGATPGSWPAGVAVLRDTLEKHGLDLSTAEIRDGSGLSHANRATARQFVDLLRRMRRHAHADLFINSLAQPGQPGSMHRRYDDPLLRGRLRGKTGTIRGVRALAGYVTRRDGRVLAFALLVNGRADHQLPREVCKTLVEADFRLQ